MMKRKLLHVLQAVAFFALLAFTLCVVSRVVERKQSRQKYGPFLENPQAYDVLFFGDSHVVNAIFPMELWEDYGLASYNLASYGNSLPVSYWTIRYALDYAQPKLIVLGVKDAEKDYKLTGSSGDLHTALDGLPLTRTKAQAIEDLLDDPEVRDDDGNRYVDMKWEYYIPFGKYHGRWNELNKGDFRYTPDRQKGALMAVGVCTPYDYEIIDDSEMLEEVGWGYSYLRLIIRECKRRGIELMLVHIPHPALERGQMAANTVGSIAQECDLHYVDFVNLDQVADYNVDSYDPYSHLNPSGARKVTDYLGRFITEHYDVPDRRSDPAYQSWNEDYAVYDRDKLNLIRGQKELKNLLMLLHDTHYSVCISVKPGSALYEDDKLITLMHNIAREHVFEEDAFCKWSNAMFPLEELDSAAVQQERYFLMIDRKNGSIRECAGDAQQLEEETSFGRVAYCAQDGKAALTIERDGQSDTYEAQDTGEYGVQILVIDGLTDEVAASVTL